MNQKKNQPQSSVNGAQGVAQVFSMTRDVNVSNPYHIDGDVDMYTQQNIKIRQQLKSNPQINKQIQQIINMYQLDQHGHILQQTYKTYQSRIALILRPQIQKDELKFVVDKDWELDSKQFQNKYITKAKLNQSIFQLIDIWTMGNSKEEYVSFCKLLKKKLQRSVKLGQ